MYKREEEVDGDGGGPPEGPAHCHLTIGAVTIFSPDVRTEWEHTKTLCLCWRRSVPPPLIFQQVHKSLASLPRGTLSLVPHEEASGGDPPAEAKQVVDTWIVCNKVTASIKLPLSGRVPQGRPDGVLLPDCGQGGKQGHQEMILAAGYSALWVNLEAGPLPLC